MKSVVFHLIPFNKKNSLFMDGKEAGAREGRGKRGLWRKEKTTDQTDQTDGG
jgi:hypothetical protein